MWDSEGVPEEYCVFDERENRYVVDPTNPGYLKILRDAIHYIISDDEGCLGADGLKIDFAFWQPVGRKARSYSGKYGVELFRELVSRIREYMKAEKPYAVLNCSPCHPYFADLCDQARLHDYDYRQRNSFEEFSQRAALYRAALPGVLIDTDGCGHNTRRDTMRLPHALGADRHSRHLLRLRYAVPLPLRRGLAGGRRCVCRVQPKGGRAIRRVRCRRRNISL